MSPKTMTKAIQSPTKKDASKKSKDLPHESDADGSASTKSELRVDPKTEKKSAGGRTNEAFSETLESEIPAIDPDELEEQEDAASAESSGTGGNAAALAAANGSTEMSASFKNFRHHPDMENFYRFIFENDLRHEALAIIDEIMIEKLQRKLVKGAKAQAH